MNISNIAEGMTVMGEWQNINMGGCIRVFIVRDFLYLSSNGLAVKVQRVFFASVLVDLGLDLLALFLVVEVNVDVYGGREAEKALF